MSLLPILVTVWLFLVGLYGIATSRNTIHLVSCLFVTQASTYVFLLSIGFRTGGTAPILGKLPPGAPLVDPVVQSLALTDIVVGATVSALILVFALQAHKKHGTSDPRSAPPMRG
ncbi:sodium:proton antiporter [Geomesophilobacter sediminis]|uniref:NADH-quinone oxidoreductase subunit K n=1 Tax=Geomesophilobacter sediminis TaxID=2798584 RepID=A0A8J7JF95_9BACT|nr:sodium:proton antiporter [Geomesophilobacter sediminis]MBJ6726111.1 NADH-quinone oxidoreductase subunit K [Geomesophilobacter sediminis]